MENVRKLRKEMGLTQRALQMKTGIEQALLSTYENGMRLPTVENLVALADHFGTNLDILPDRTDQQTPFRG